MRHRPIVVLTGAVAASLVAASGLALGGDPEPVVPIAAAGDDDPSSDDLGITGDDTTRPASPEDSPSADDSPSPADSPSPEDVASPVDQVSVTGSETHTVADAGTVTVAATTEGLVVTVVTPAAGWTSFVEQARGREVEVTFRDGDARVDFKAEIEYGGVRIRVRDRRLEDAAEAAEAAEEAEEASEEAQEASEEASEAAQEDAEDARREDEDRSGSGDGTRDDDRDDDDDWDDDSDDDPDDED